MADYAGGKADWLGHSLPREGDTAGTEYAGELADRDPPTCALETPLSDIAQLLESSGYGYCLIVNEQRVVLGRVRRSALAGSEATALAESAMEPGPSTVRPNKPAAGLAKRLTEQELHTAILTTPRGVLLGVFHRDGVKRGGRGAGNS